MTAFASFFLNSCAGTQAEYQPPSIILPPHIKSIAVRPIDNQTSQPDIDNKLWLAITNEFIRDGRIKYADKEADADGIVIGTLKQYRETELSHDVKYDPARISTLDRHGLEDSWTNPTTNTSGKSRCLEQEAPLFHGDRAGGNHRRASARTIVGAVCQRRGAPHHRRLRQRDELVAARRSQGPASGQSAAQVSQHGAVLTLPSQRPEEFDAAVRAGKIGRFYLFEGPESWLKERALEAITAKLVSPESRDFNFDRFDGNDADAGAIVTATQSLPFLGDRRLVIVNAADELAAADGRRVAEILADVPASTCLVFVFDGKANLREEIPAQVSSLGVVVTFWTPFPNQLPAWAMAGKQSAKAKR